MPSYSSKCMTCDHLSMLLIQPCVMPNWSSLSRRPLQRPELTSSARSAKYTLPIRNYSPRFLDQVLLSTGQDNLRRSCSPSSKGASSGTTTYQQMENLKNDSYAVINPGTCVPYFLGGIDIPSLKTAVQICESQDNYSVIFQNCSLYLITMGQWTLAAKQVNVASTPTKVDGIMLKTKDGTDQCLPPDKYSGSVYKLLSLK